MLPDLFPDTRLLPSEAHLPALANDRIAIRTLLLTDGPAPSWLLRRKLRFGEFRLRRALANDGWFCRTVGEWHLTEEAILTAQASPATIPAKEITDETVNLTP